MPSIRPFYIEDPLPTLFDLSTKPSVWQRVSMIALVE
jgi:hypothetical protein